MDSFGTRLANFRRERNLTQNEIADRLNISAQAVSKWENDLTSPDIETLIKLSEIFNISVDELVGRKSSDSEFVPTEERKDIHKMMLRLRIKDKDGNAVRMNLPMAAVEMIINNENASAIFNGNKALEAIDFKQIYELAEQGLMGELLSVDSADGDHITVNIE